MTVDTLQTLGWDQSLLSVLHLSDILQKNIQVYHGLGFPSLQQHLPHSTYDGALVEYQCRHNSGHRERLIFVRGSYVHIWESHIKNNLVSHPTNMERQVNAGLECSISAF